MCVWNVSATLPFQRHATKGMNSCKLNVFHGVSRGASKGRQTEAETEMATLLKTCTCNLLVKQHQGASCNTRHAASSQKKQLQEIFSKAAIHLSISRIQSERRAHVRWLWLDSVTKRGQQVGMRHGASGMQQAAWAKWVPRYRTQPLQHTWKPEKAANSWQWQRRHSAWELGGVALRGCLTLTWQCLAKYPNKADQSSLINGIVCYSNLMSKVYSKNNGKCIKCASHEVIFVWEQLLCLAYKGDTH